MVFRIKHNLHRPKVKRSGMKQYATQNIKSVFGMDLGVKEEKPKPKYKTVRVKVN